MFAITERLLLRPGWVEDAPALHAAIAHESVAFRLARLPWPYTLDHARDYLTQERGGEDVACLITLRHGDAARMIGGLGLHPTPDGTLELGYWVNPSYWGHGYATEAAGALVDAARDSLKRDALVSGYFEDNFASGRVLAKLGFVVTGRDQRHCLAQGRTRPSIRMGLELRSVALAA